MVSNELTSKSNTDDKELIFNTLKLQEVSKDSILKIQSSISVIQEEFYKVFIDIRILY